MFGKAFANSLPLQITLKNRNFHKGANNSVLICIFHLFNIKSVVCLVAGGKGWKRPLLKYDSILCQCYNLDLFLIK